MSNGSFFKSSVKIIIRTIIRFEPLKRLLRDISLRKLRKFPHLVQPEITNACNANCIMCPQEEMTRKIGEMDFNLYRKIIDECSKNRARVKTICPFLNGEPLLNHRLKDHISYAKEKNRKAEVIIYTNASLLDEKRALELMDSGLDKMFISFDGCTKETYERIRQNLDFEIVNNNVLRFFQLKKQLKRKKPQVDLSIIEMEETKRETEKFITKWKPLADSVTVKDFSNWGGKFSEKDQKKELKIERYPCPRLWFHLVILRDGNVAICCLDYDGKFILGNVKKNSIREIWNGEVINNYRSLHIRGEYEKISICEKCNSWKFSLPLLWW